MTLQELKARVDAATGPDRELDIDLAIALKAWPKGFSIDLDGRVWQRYIAQHDTVEFWEPAAYTASIDAALATAAEKLPRCRIKLERAFGTTDGWYCEIAQWKGETFDSITAEHTFCDNGALAILKAFVAAWEAQR